MACLIESRAHGRVISGVATYAKRLGVFSGPFAASSIRVAHRVALGIAYPLGFGKVEFTMRILALDIGQTRIGVAVSDPRERVASPVCVLPANEVLSNAKSWKRVLEDWEPELLLSGLPYTLSGEEGPQAQRIRGVANNIAKAANLPVEFTDERLSSQEAKRSLRESGMSERDMRGKIDMIAASVFLQAWLDARNSSER